MRSLLCREPLRGLHGSGRPRRKSQTPSVTPRGPFCRTQCTKWSTFPSSRIPQQPPSYQETPPGHPEVEQCGDFFGMPPVLLHFGLTEAPPELNLAAMSEENDVLRQAFSLRVDRLRIARGLSRKQLALRVGSRTAFGRWGKGRAWPRAETLYRLSEELGVTLDFLVLGRGPMRPGC